MSTSLNWACAAGENFGVTECQNHVSYRKINAKQCTISKNRLRRYLPSIRQNLREHVHDHEFSRKSTQIAFQAELISLEQIVPRESSEVEPGRRGVQKTTCEFDPQLAVSQDNRFWEGRCHKTEIWKRISSYRIMLRQTLSVLESNRVDLMSVIIMTGKLWSASVRFPWRLGPWSYGTCVMYRVQRNSARLAVNNILHHLSVVTKPQIQMVHERTSQIFEVSWIFMVSRTYVRLYCYKVRLSKKSKFLKIRNFGFLNENSK